MTRTAMRLDSLDPVASKERHIIRIVSCYVIPALMALLTLWVLFFLPTRYPAPQGHGLPYHASPGPSHQAPTPELIEQWLQQAELNSPHTIGKNQLLFQLPILPPQTSPYLVHLTGGDLQALTCRRGPEGHPLPSGPATQSPWKLPLSGHLIELGANPGPAPILCEVQATNTERLKLELWTADELPLFSSYRTRGISLLEGGLSALALFILIIAAVHRRPVYLLLAMWLIGNLRLGALVMGWDTQWLGHELDSEHLPQIRRWTLAGYFLISYSLFSHLLSRTLSGRYTHQWLRPVAYLGLLLALITPFAPNSVYLPILAFCALIAVSLIGYLLLKVLRQAGSRTQLWHLVLLSMVLCVLLSGLFLLLFGRSAFIETFNGVVTLLLSSLMVSLVLAEKMRDRPESGPSMPFDLDARHTLSPVGFFTLDQQGRFLSMDSLVQDMLGVHFDPAHPLYWDDFFPPQNWSDVALHQSRGIPIEPVHKPNAPALPTQFLLRALSDSPQVYASLQDFSEPTQRMAQLQLAADSDPLTHLLNQRGIEKVLSRLLAQSKDQTGSCMLAYLNLNYLKYITPGMGQTSSECLLQAAGQQISRLLTGQQHVGRLSNDEFLILFPNSSAAEVHTKASEIIHALNDTPISVGNRSFTLKSTIGLVEVSGDMSTEAISAAHRAARDARKQMQDVVLYTQNSNELNQHAAELRLFDELEGGSSRGLFLEMQPIMSLHSPLDSLNVEILLRVRDAKGQLLPSGRIISAAEQSDTILIIDKWVFGSTLEWLAKHEKNLPNTQQININLSGVSLNNDNFISSFMELLGKHEHLLQRICVEITEGVALEDLERTRQFMTQLQKMGVRIALDDFGAGYTSFQYLRELPADAIKIDGALICDMLKKETNVAIVRTIVKLANNLGMITIAEWVEDVPTLKALAEIGVDYVQGFAIARPCSPNDILNAGTILDLIPSPETRAVVQALQNAKAKTART